MHKGLSTVFTDLYFLNLTFLPHRFIADLAGGICQHIVNIRNKGPRSTNTGLVTVLNGGNKVLDGVTEVVLAHEFGHNFGSEVSTELTIS